MLDASTFAKLQEANYFRRLPPQELLEVAELLANKTDTLYVVDAHEDVLPWGQRIMYLTELAGTQGSTSDFLDQQHLESIVARAHAFLGDFAHVEQYLSDHAEVGLRRVTSQKTIRSSYFYRVLTTVVKSICIQQSREAAIVLLFEVSYPRWRTIKMGSEPFFIDERLGELLGFFRLPTLLDHTADWDPSRRQELRDFILSAFNGWGNFAKAHDLITSLHRMRLDSSSSLVVQTVIGLLSRNDIRKNEKLADDLYRLLSPETPDYYALGRLVKRKPPDSKTPKVEDSFAQSLIAEARSVFERLPSAKKARTGATPTQPVVAARLPSIIPQSPPNPQTKGMPTTMSAFDAEYPMGPSGQRTPLPGLNVYLVLGREFKHIHDHHSIISLWEDMKWHNIKPDVFFLNIVLQAYRAVWDSKGAVNVLEYMKQHGVQGDSILYTILIRLLTSRLDLTAAEEAYKHAMNEGLSADMDLKLAMLSAYLKCGAWKKGIALFTELRNSGAQLTTATYNAILEGCIFIGAPFKTVLRLFARLEMEGIKPDKYTYTILMHHAVIGRHWAFAQSLYQDMLRMDAGRPAYARNVDITLLTMMMRGFLAGGRLSEAKEIVSEMKRLGLEHTAITHATIARAYAHTESADDLALAEAYVRDVVAGNDAWRARDAHRMRKQPLALLFAPLIAGRAVIRDVDGAEQLMGEFLAAGGEPSIGILRHLLKLYGEAGRFDDMRTVWESIVALARAPQSGAGAAVVTSMRNISAPVDVYTRILSQRGHHAELARTWTMLADAGNEFDEENWNTYALACLRAGAVVRAFEVIERILQPNFNIGLRNHFSPPVHPALPFAVKLDAIERLRGGPPARPLVKDEHRARAAHVNRSTNRRRAELADAGAIAEDFAYPLRALRKLGPGWKDWKPVPMLLRSMLMAVLYLEDGFPIRALAPGETRALDIAPAETEDRSVTEPLLKLLFEEHPRTAHRLMRFRASERKTLGNRGFSQAYIWSR